MNALRISRTLILVVVFISATVGLNAWTSYKKVYVHTDASPEYLAQRSPDKPESYYFFEGMYFGGRINDKSLKKVEFIEIAQGLAPHLAKQDYWPAQSKETCDLLLIVSWGITEVDAFKDIYLDYLNDGYFDNFISTSFFHDQRYSYETVQAAKLIGFYPHLNWDRYDIIPHFRHQDYELREALDTERYFMIVTAFDFQALVSDKQWRRVWSTRFSMRSPGTNFYKAHLALSKAGGNYFGKNLDKLGKERADFDPIIADVEIGEIEVLETIDSPTRRGIMNSIRLSEDRR
ncbi:MAG: hypothetical protein O3C43_12080 [Verrucomicrobia bacterium]|nr:hypothetical protein [Verrucomicrobiota bacterium]MDA1067230.1 hypothetical protein [Verrucomicrobiota bacterium]